jgi:hypothetical protein
MARPWRRRPHASHTHSHSHAFTSEDWTVHVTCRDCGASWEYRGRSGRTMCPQGHRVYVPAATRRAAGEYEPPARARQAPPHSPHGASVGRPARDDAIYEDAGRREYAGTDDDREPVDAVVVVLGLAGLGVAWWCWRRFGCPWWRRRAGQDSASVSSTSKRAVSETLSEPPVSEEEPTSRAPVAAWRPNGTSVWLACQHEATVSGSVPTEITCPTCGAWTRPVSNDLKNPGS